MRRALSEASAVFVAADTAVVADIGMAVVDSAADAGNVELEKSSDTAQTAAMAVLAVWYAFRMEILPRK